ncbi:hypothetical protein ACFYSJ_36515 [Streptomyces sp. NPDC005248]|uniref:hypothetical protein n=1 Tax=Streptomyces sp. NPDC005248 TaxID=3364709 RepID=UPI00369729B4
MTLTSLCHLIPVAGVTSSAMHSCDLKQEGASWPARGITRRPHGRPVSAPPGKLWTTRTTRNLTATLERLRVDRQLEETLAHDADPLHLALVLGIDEKTAIRYADSARALLDQAAEQRRR